MSINKYDSTTGDLIPIHSGEVMYADSPIGTISIFSGTTLPNGYLWCNGAEYDIVDYPELYAVLGSNWNGTKTPTTGKFFVPDLRELVPVGASSGNNTTYTIVAHDTYGIGTFKDDQVLDHAHYRFVDGNGSSYAGAGGTGAWTPSSTAGLYGNATGGVLNTYRRGTTTHGKQIGVNYIIKAKQNPMPSDMQGEVDYINGEITQIKSDLSAIPIIETGSINIQALSLQEITQKDIVYTKSFNTIPKVYLTLVTAYGEQYTSVMSQSKTGSRVLVKNNANVTTTAQVLNWVAIGY